MVSVALGGESFPDRPGSGSRGARLSWLPSRAVAQARATAGRTSTSPAAASGAEALLEQSAVTRGEIIEMDDAIELGKRIFGNLLND